LVTSGEDVNWHRLKNMCPKCPTVPPHMERNQKEKKEGGGKKGRVVPRAIES